MDVYKNQTRNVTRIFVRSYGFTGNTCHNHRKNSLKYKLSLELSHMPELIDPNN